MYIINFIRGFCMALADSVPGVSGGTIAFVLGFYDKFLETLSVFFSKSTKEEKKEAICFLFKLGTGWVVGMILAILFLSSLFTSHIYKVSSLFIGFIIFAIPLILKEEKENLKGKYINVIYTIIGILVVFLITKFNPVSNGGDTSISISGFNIGVAIYVFIAGMIAISAMILPGISGSTLLLIFGVYTSIITGVKDVLHLNFSSLPILIIFCAGVIVGIATTINGIRYLLKKHRVQTLYTILGLMIGSIYAVIMGPTTLESPVAALDFNNFSIIFFIIGAAIMLGLEQLKKSLIK